MVALVEVADNERRNCYTATLDTALQLHERALVHHVLLHRCGVDLQEKEGKSESTTLAMGWLGQHTSTAQNVPGSQSAAHGIEGLESRPSTLSALEGPRKSPVHSWEGWRCKTETESKRQNHDE